MKCRRSEAEQLHYYKDSKSKRYITNYIEKYE